MTTPEVIRGAPILAIDYSPTSAAHLGEMAGPEPGEFGGWTFLHATDGMPADADLYFFDQIPEVDPQVRTIVEAGKPGTWMRETGFAPFES